MISVPRLAPYREECRGQLAAALDLYGWNSDVSAGFYKLLQWLSFGFWTALTGSTNDYETRIWRPCLHRAFPHHPQTRGNLTAFRKQINNDLTHMGRLRNRIAHHEPIHHRHLKQDQDTILRLLGYISPEKQLWTKKQDRIPELLRSAPPREP